ncbi:MAG: hypothetical protein DI563_00225 [Variovorax paradoxus]|uniref:ABC transporter domain-containing protein n=1 Tax=Variovorax paradoxus TaxID=34073 RepID=A0A2W5QIN6_VARPD|nr:MAG: hypothetical protein DI563_00225 [Variovorax paradoxus]
MLARSLSGERFALVAFIALIAVTPLFVQSEYVLGVLIVIGTLAISATGMVLMFGLAHQLVLGQAAFCLIGAYGSGLLTLKAGWSPLPALLAWAAISMISAYLLGKPILRLRGFVLAMASLAVQLILIHVASESMELTGGAMGLTGVPAFSVLGWRFESAASFFYLVWAFALLAVFICRNIAVSRIGLGLRAIATTEAGAASVGIDIAKQKVRMFVLSAAMASIAGSLTAHYLRLIEPQVFNLQYGFAILTSVIIGGLTSPWGGVIGAALVTALREGMKGFSMPLLEMLIMGIATVLALIAMPGGIVGMLRSWQSRDRSDAARGAAPLAGGATPKEVAKLPMSTRTDRQPSGDLLKASNVSIAFGSLKAVDSVSFAVPEGQITALIGPNGAGKTTTFNLLCGYLPCSSGKVMLDGREIQDLRVDEIARLGVARTFQLIQLFGGMTVLENVMAGRTRFAHASIGAICAATPHARREAADARLQAIKYLDFVGLSELADASPQSLPFGQQRQVELARALACEPRLIIMDEPASGLNDSETEELARLIVRIRAAGTTVLLVEHDLRLVMGLSDHVVVLDRGRKLEEGPPNEVRNAKSVIDAYLVGSNA